jgi:hypothetical protein
MITREHIELSIKRAMDGQSNLSQEQLAVRGFSTPTIRRLFSNLCNIEGTYLEIGLFCGATFVSSFNPKLKAIGIEDHSQDFSEGFELIKKELKDNVDKFARKAKDVHVHYADCFKIDKSLLPDNIDIMFWDGEHTLENQSKALPHFLDKLADRFIAVTDDYNWTDVENGTNSGLELLRDKIEIEGCWVLRGYHLNNDSVWHNGVHILLAKKK